MAAHSKLWEVTKASALYRHILSSKVTVFVSIGAIAVCYNGFRKLNCKPSTSRPSSTEDKTEVIEQQHTVANAAKTSKERSIGVDGEFLKKLFGLAKILVPGWLTPETGYMLLVAASVIASTYSELWVIENTTHIQSRILERDNIGYLKYLLTYVSAMPLLALIDQLGGFGLEELKLRFRSRLTNFLYASYLQGYTYYQMSNLDNRISNPDQLLTQGTEKFCDNVAELYSNLSKPILTIIVYAMKVTSRIGGQAPASLVAYLLLSGILLNKMRQPLARLTAKQQKLEGEFRYVNSRLITNSEEVAFYKGNSKERHIIFSAFGSLRDHIRRFIQFKFIEGVFDNIIAKYVATLVGHWMVSRPFLDLEYPRYLNSSILLRMEDYYQSGRMLVKMAESIGLLVSAGRDMTTLAGFTGRITKLMQVLDDLNRGRYQRTMVKDSSRDSQSKIANLKPGSGTVRHQDHVIRFDQVPLVTPNGDVLADEMTFEVKSGVNVLVCGPNGCGKSSLFRVLGELWPLYGGTLTKPDKGKLFYVPQRPYMTLGTLRDQVIYPDTKDDMRRKRISDSQLVTYLNKVQLENILEREGGWDSVQDWMDVLSGGEKQRIAMARLFYHKPQFAILDECTSAVSMDVEGAMYKYCKETGISLFTVSHRKSLLTYHEYYLRLNGRGEYDYQPITDKEINFE
ncbi:ATP-binding cassette sub-family D member 3-like [Watersipora subatra]|uniref:ATP-binding cassette sub-family D member 3-like n=1 Tax=Watersipora subatra TaxID=2589382 RepID=UPI00355C1403